MPAVVGEIMAGILLGKTVLGRVAPDAFLWLFPEGTPRTLLSGYTTVAAVLLLVVAGFEIDLTVVRRSSRAAILTSALGAAIPFAIGYGAGMALPDGDLADPSRRGVHAAFLGIALSISALPVIARTLLDLGLMKTDLGIIVLSAAVCDDLVGWIGFTVLAREFVSTGSTDLVTIARSVGLTVAFVICTLVVVRPLVDRLLARLGDPQQEAGGRVLSMIMVLAMLGAAATEALGMHAVFGGFVMGLAIGDSSRLREHTRSILHEFVTNVFTPVFFATMALRVDFAAAFDLRLVVLVLSIA
jgi:Kef-type K+ transport system membrane component KefB